MTHLSHQRNRHCVLTFMRSHTCRQLDPVPERWSNPRHGCQADAWTLCIWAHGWAIRILWGIEEFYAVTLNLLLASSRTSPHLRALSWPAPFAHLDACHLIRETETWAVSNLSASLHSCSQHSCYPTVIMSFLISAGIEEVQNDFRRCLHASNTEVVLRVNYSTADGNVLPLCPREVKFSISWACLTRVPLFRVENKLSCKDLMHRMQG